MGKFISTRRFFMGDMFSKSLLTLGAAALFLSKKKGHVLRVYEISLPSGISEQAFEKMTQGWVKNDEIVSLKASFQKEGKILFCSKKFHTEEKVMRYTYVFDSKRSFWDWESHMGKVFDESKMTADGLKIKSYCKMA